MHLAAYHFDGDPELLQAGYEHMIATLPAGEVLLNLSVARPDGITVYDACPSVDDFVSFSASDDFSSALTAAGLPMPRIESLGEVRGAHGTAIVPIG